MDIVDLLHREIYLESVANGARSRPIEAMKLAIEEIERLRVSEMARKLARMHPESKDADDLRRLIKEAEGREG